MRGTRALALAAVALIGIPAGCGGGSTDTGRLTKAQYEQRVQADGTALSWVTAGLRSNTSSFQALKKAVVSARQVIDSAARDLDSLKPPQEAVAANRAFVAALRQTLVELGALEKAADHSDLNRIIAIARGMSASKQARAAQAAAAELKKRGYHLGALSG